MSLEEYHKASLFLREQMRHYQDRHTARTFSAIYGFSWTSILSWKPSLIRKQIETRCGDNELNSILGEHRLDPDITANEFDFAGVGLIDPLIRETVRRQLYYTDIGLPPSLHYTRFVQDLSMMILEVRLLTLFEDGPYLVSYMDDFPPFGIIYSQAIRTIADVKLPLMTGGLNEPQLESIFEESRRRLRLWAQELGRSLSRKEHLPHIRRLRSWENGLLYVEIDFRRDFEERILNALLLTKLDPGILASHEDLCSSPIKNKFESALHSRASYSINQRADLESTTVDLASLDAAYICSGPYRLMLTTLPENHLALDPDGFIHIFFDFRKTIGCSLNVYKGHFLWDRDGSASR